MNRTIYILVIAELHSYRDLVFWIISSTMVERVELTISDVVMDFVRKCESISVPRVS
jgi:hypothetical protein